MYNNKLVIFGKDESITWSSQPVVYDMLPIVLNSIEAAVLNVHCHVDYFEIGIGGPSSVKSELHDDDSLV